MEVRERLERLRRRAELEQRLLSTQGIPVAPPPDPSSALPELSPELPRRPLSGWEFGDGDALPELPPDPPIALPEPSPELPPDPPIALSESPSELPRRPLSGWEFGDGDALPELSPELPSRPLSGWEFGDGDALPELSPELPPRPLSGWEFEDGDGVGWASFRDGEVTEEAATDPSPESTPAADLPDHQARQWLPSAPPWPDPEEPAFVPAVPAGLPPVPLQAPPPGSAAPGTSAEVAAGPEQPPSPLVQDVLTALQPVLERHPGLTVAVWPPGDVATDLASAVVLTFDAAAGLRLLTPRPAPGEYHRAGPAAHPSADDPRAGRSVAAELASLLRARDRGGAADD
ncbi:MAG TPA: hypothetical protein VFP72_19505 [Kineosporiaceae bacterium]|nr:hypothetical protein [Kineosporiaceae bacterium]